MQWHIGICALLCTIANSASAQQDFCIQALKYIPYESGSKVSIESFIERVIAESCHQEFTQEEQFSSWSKSSDGGASYKSFSLFGSSAKGGSQSSFSERFYSFCQNQSFAVDAYRKYNEDSTGPSEAYITEVLSKCPVEPGLYAIPRWTREAPNKFIVDFKYVPVAKLVPSWSVNVVNALCEQNGQSVSRIERISTARASFLCQRKDESVSGIAFSSDDVGSAGFDLPTAASIIGSLDERLSSQEAEIDQLALDIEALSGKQFSFSNERRDISASELNGSSKSVRITKSLVSDGRPVMLIGSSNVGRNDSATYRNFALTLTMLIDDNICASDRFWSPAGPGGDSALQSITCITQKKAGEAFTVELVAQSSSSGNTQYFNAGGYINLSALAFD